MLDFGDAVQASFRSLPFGTNTLQARLTRSMSMSFYYSYRTHNKLKNLSLGSYDTVLQFRETRRSHNPS
jgi:hypothetical protein